MSFVDCQTAAASHLTVLIHHAMDITLTHRRRVVNMLRSEASILAKNQFYAQKCHRDSNY